MSTKKTLFKSIASYELQQFYFVYFLKNIIKIISHSRSYIRLLFTIEKSRCQTPHLFGESLGGGVSFSGKIFRRVASRHSDALM